MCILQGLVLKTKVTDWENPDYKPIFTERYQRLRNLQNFNDRALTEVWAYYRENPADWVEDWAMTYAPAWAKTGSDFVPFILFPKQRELIDWLHERFRTRTAGVIEKSRDTGISYIMAVFGLWAWIFHDAKVGFGSYIQRKVDVLGEMDSLFEKMRQMVKHLPEEVLPPDFDFDKNTKLYSFTKPDSRASVYGEVGKNLGRGGRSTMYFVDEFAHFEHPDLVDASLSATTPCKIWASTPKGLGNFFKKCTGGVFPVFRFHWTDDPRKTDEWAAQMRREIGPVRWAQEYDLDHGASVENILIDSCWVQASRQLLRAYKKKGIPVPPKSFFSEGIAGQDVGHGHAKSVFIARHGPYVSKPIAWDEADTTNTARRAIRHAKRHGTALLNFDAIGVGAGVQSTLRHSDDLFLPVPETPAREPDGIEELINQAAQEEAGEHHTEVPQIGTRIMARAINVGQPAADFIVWPDGKKSCEKFANTRAEICWILRDRFQKTYETWLWLTDQDGGAQHPFDELIVIPEDDDLEKQLSLLTWFEQPSGKLAIESKKDLAARGVASPDIFDALSLTFVPIKPGLKVGKVKGWI